MPRYEYRCSECGFQGDVWAKMGEAPETVSIDCGTADPFIHPLPICVLRRVLSSFAGKFGDTPTHHTRAPRK